MGTYESSVIQARRLRLSGFEVQKDVDLARGKIVWSAYRPGFTKQECHEWTYFMFGKELEPTYIHHNCPDEFIQALESADPNLLEPYENRGFVDFTLHQSGFSKVHTWDPQTLTDAQLTRLARLACRIG